HPLTLSPRHPLTLSPCHPVTPQVTGDTFRYDRPLLGAIVEGDAVIGIAAQEEAGMAGEAGCNPGDALEMAQMVLRNGAVPADDLVIDRCGADLHGQAQLAAHAFQQPRVAPADH